MSLNSNPPPPLTFSASSLHHQPGYILIVMDFRTGNSAFDCILFDLDDTLYSSSLGIQKACKKNIEEYLASKCNVSAERAANLRVEHFRTYGSSLSGLIALGYDVHPDEYHSFVHGRLPYERIRPDPELRELLYSIPQAKMLFTNSDIKHVKTVLEKLGVEEDLFDGIICFETLNPHLFNETPSTTEVILKPSIAAIQAAVRLSGFDRRRTLFLDDSERNIAAGGAVGLRTVLVGKGEKNKEADYLIEGMSSLKRVIPEIWVGEDEDQGRRMTVRREMDSNIPAASVEA